MTANNAKPQSTFFPVNAPAKTGDIRDQRRDAERHRHSDAQNEARRKRYRRLPKDRFLRGTPSNSHLNRKQL